MSLQGQRADQPPGDRGLKQAKARLASSLELRILSLALGSSGVEADPRLVGHTDYSLGP